MRTGLPRCITPRQAASSCWRVRYLYDKYGPIQRSTSSTCHTCHMLHNARHKPPTPACPCAQHSPGSGLFRLCRGRNSGRRRWRGRGRTLRQPAACKGQRLRRGRLRLRRMRAATLSHCKRLRQLDAARLLRVEQRPHDGLFRVIRLHRITGGGADADVSAGCHERTS